MTNNSRQEKDFYRAFEEKYRGSRELIKSRLEVYLPFIEKVKDFDIEPNALDLGCGRGEWLELISEHGFQAQGVDLDEGMLASSQSRGLNGIQKDALQALEELDDNSCSVVSGFHIAEHLPFETLQLLTQEALRVLKPGGLLILETPNPENIQVATASFYLDPTHIRPIPSQLLSFLTEHYGFLRTKVLRLQEFKELHNEVPVSLAHVIYSVSPDYAIVAQKQANNEIIASFDDLYNIEYGLSLEALVNRFENRLSLIQAQAADAKTQAADAKTQAADAKTQAADAKTQAADAKTQAADAQAQATTAWNNYIMVISSRSWKITKPLRIAGKALKWFKVGMVAWLTFSPSSRPRRVFKKIIFQMKNYINTHPRVKMKLINVLNHFPALKARLKQTVQEYHNVPINSIAGPEQLSPRAKKIYMNLKSAIEHRDKEVGQ